MERDPEGRLLTTPGAILRCMLNGVLTIADADAIKDRLSARRFVMKFASFGDLVPRPGSEPTDDSGP
jgi:hypothetical protein